MLMGSLPEKAVADAKDVPLCPLAGMKLDPDRNLFRLSTPPLKLFTV